jgi:hypothetical protein
MGEAGLLRMKGMENELKKRQDADFLAFHPGESVFRGFFIFTFVLGKREGKKA